MLEGYKEQFGNHLQKFVDIEVPRALSTLSEAERTRITEGTGDFPKDIIKAVLASTIDEQQKIHDIVVIAGSWMNAASGSRWAIGPIDERPYAERVGIGIESPSNNSFTPLLAQAEELVHDEPERDENLVLLAAFAEFDKHQAAK